jgi:hypothetical protein
VKLPGFGAKVLGGSGAKVVSSDSARAKKLHCFCEILFCHTTEHQQQISCGQSPSFLTRRMACGREETAAIMGGEELIILLSGIARADDTARPESAERTTKPSISMAWRSGWPAVSALRFTLATRKMRSH